MHLYQSSYTTAVEVVREPTAKQLMKTLAIPKAQVDNFEVGESLNQGGVVIKKFVELRMFTRAKARDILL